MIYVIVASSYTFFHTNFHFSFHPYKWKCEWERKRKKSLMYLTFSNWPQFFSLSLRLMLLLLHPLLFAIFLTLHSIMYYPPYRTIHKMEMWRALMLKLYNILEMAGCCGKRELFMWCKLFLSKRQRNRTEKTFFFRFHALTLFTTC